MDRCPLTSQDTVRSPEWLESDGLLMFRGKINVPKDRDLRCCIAIS
jgi:hypothetical protein